MIFQFLLYHEFSATLSAFKEELPRLNYQNVEENVIKKEHIKRMHVHRLTELFTCADFDEFYKVILVYMLHNNKMHDIRFSNCEF